LAETTIYSCCAEIYFSSFLKIINYKPLFNNVSEYLFYEISGSFSTSYQTLLPNSNLIMEVIFTNGIYIGGLLLCIFSYLNFYIRKIILYKKQLKLIDLILFNYFVMTPLWWFISGTEFIINLIISIMLGILINLYCNFRRADFWYNFRFKIY